MRPRATGSVAHMRTGRNPVLPGTVARWENRILPMASAFVVELPAGALPASAVAANARAVAAMAEAVAPPAPAA